MRTFATLLSALCLCTAHSGYSWAQAPLTQAIHDAYVANQSSFDMGVFKFEYAKGKSSNVADARRGDFDPKYSLVGSYAFQADEARLDSVFPESVMRETTRFIGTDTVQSSLVSYRVATNGEVSVSEMFTVNRSRPGMTGSLKMLAGKSHFLEFFEFPLSLGQPDGIQSDNLGPRLREVLKGNPEYRILELDPNADLEGRGVIKLSVASPVGREDYWVDLERGAVPLKVEFHYRDGEVLRLGSVMFNDELTQIPDRGWLPYRRSWHSDLSDDAIQYAIVKANFDKPPTRAELGVDFGEPVALRNESTHMSYSPRKFWDLSALPSPGSSEVTKVQPPSVSMDQVPKLPGQRSSPRNLRLMGLGVLGLLAVIGLRVWMKRRN